MNNRKILTAESIFTEVVDIYGLNKALSTVACTLAGALIGFVIGANLIPNDSTNTNN